MIWCLGLYASGSTWVFNAAMQVAAAVAPDTPPVGRFLDSHQALDWCDEPNRLSIVKSHDTDPAAALELMQRADAILLSIRDPRDCVSSLMLYQRHNFAQALGAVERTARFCARFVGHKKVRLLRYEAGFYADINTLDLIADCRGATLTEPERARIFADTRRASIERHIAALQTLPTTLHDARSGDAFDPATQWHAHHANRSGEVGRWRHMLTLAEVAGIEQTLQDCMVDLGYALAVIPYVRCVGSETLRL